MKKFFSIVLIIAAFAVMQGSATAAKMPNDKDVGYSFVLKSIEQTNIATKDVSAIELNVPAATEFSYCSEIGIEFLTVKQFSHLKEIDYSANSRTAGRLIRKMKYVLSGCFENTSANKRSKTITRYLWSNSKRCMC